MDHEPSEHPHQCNHDADVMCHSRFFDRTLRTHLDRQRLNALMDAETHWVFVVTPKCGELILKLHALYVERCEAEHVPVFMTMLPMMPMFICFPRDKLALDDLADLVNFTMGSSEAYESKDYIIMTSLNNDLVNQVVSQWISVDHLVN
jgi:hypothetical protein